MARIRENVLRRSKVEEMELTRRSSITMEAGRALLMELEWQRPEQGSEPGATNQSSSPAPRPRVPPPNTLPTTRHCSSQSATGLDALSCFCPFASHRNEWCMLRAIHASTDDLEMRLFAAVKCCGGCSHDDVEQITLAANASTHWLATRLQRCHLLLKTRFTLARRPLPCAFSAI